jgi:hypothetical protein
MLAWTIRPAWAEGDQVIATTTQTGVLQLYDSCGTDPFDECWVTYTVSTDRTILKTIGMGLKTIGMGALEVLQVLLGAWKGEGLPKP